VSKPFLHLGDIRLMIQGIGRSSGTKCMHTQALDSGDPHLTGIGLHDSGAVLLSLLTMYAKSDCYEEDERHR
jgi:hypothetical protein